MLPRQRLAELMEVAGKLPGVVQVEAIGAEGMVLARFVKEHDINRLILAGYSPRDAEKPMEKMAKEVGFNPSLISYANLGAAYDVMHRGREEEATANAYGQIEMAWERARRLQPLRPGTGEVNKSVLVVGGGLAGMTASLRLAEMGYAVYLVERETEIGGNLRNLSPTLQGPDPQSFLEELKRQDYENAADPSLDGERSADDDKGGERLYNNGAPQGCFALVEHGALIIATGGREITPSGFHYGE